MAILNDIISLNIKELKKEILKSVEEEIDHELYYLDEINEDRKKILKKNILKNMKIKINTDNFIYTVMDKNICTFKHTRGKKDGHFCCKKITKKGDKKKFVCRTHNKNHIPNKKIKHLKDKSLENKKVNEKVDHEKNNENYNYFDNEKHNINNIDLIKVKKIMKKISKNKIYIGNYGSFIFSNIIKNYTNLLLKQNIFNLTLFAERNFNINELS